ncbi:MAG: dihydrolipoyl dehydrogenase, partial [Alteromonas sp.]|nr:dihydrolipoyl dehydrogenase [Alteromonas sp.]
MSEIKTQLVVLGAGPGGYSAAFRAADMGIETVLVDARETLGGVCLNVGCIPSKALLHVAKVMKEAKHLASHGVSFGEPEIDLDKIRAYKDGVVGQLTKGLAGMSKMRKVKHVQGYGKFTGANTLEVEGKDGKTTISFENAIIAAGSEPVSLPFIPEDDRVIDSTGALEMKDIPEKMLVLGGGIIGLEMGTVYEALGSNIDVVEFLDQLIPAADKDIMKVFMKTYKEKFNIMLETKVTGVEAKDDGLYVSFEGKNAPAEPVRYDKVLVAVGRKPNGGLVAADKAGVKVDERGFISVDKQMKTNVGHIYAIGDLVGQPMLAHKAVHEGHVAAENIAGKKHFFDPRCIPSVAYTEPEVAWVGLTEKEAKEQGVSYETATFPWAASGRAIASDATDGMTKMIFDKDSGRVIGGAMIGTNAGEMLGEIGLAIEMGADAEDVALTIHAHPT